MTIEEINKETNDYYNSIKEGAGLKLLVRFKDMSDIDNLDFILDELKDKKPSLNLPDKTPEEDELTTWLREKTERQRELERKGKIKVRI